MSYIEETLKRSGKWNMAGRGIAQIFDEGGFEIHTFLSCKIIPQGFISFDLISNLGPG